ncbi:penicillin-binding protein 2 [bacterium LRH843]|nr:penicillin-binding protein 2 [bacterium LRH843]
MNKGKHSQKQKKKYHVPARLNVLFFIVFILFSALILRLGMVQILEGEEFVKELEKTSNTTARIDAPRGIMYDRYGNIVVDNELELSVTYTNPSRVVKPTALLEIATELEQLIDVETERITDRDKRDFILVRMTEEERYELVSKKERSNLESISEEYKLEVERIPQSAIDSLTEHDLRVLAIYREMARGYANSPQRIKRGITEEEAHRLSENLDRLPGVDILRDSRRTYAYGDSFRSLFGSTGAIPREQLDYYLSRGYDRSDTIGTSFLELQYENVLRGQKAVLESITTSSAGQTVDRSVNEKLGQRGNDLVLTLDMELQQKIETVIEEEMKLAGNSFISDRSAYVVAMDPRTGDILAMVGFNDPRGGRRGSYSDHIGNVNKAFEMGSSIKAASVLTGFQEGVTQPGNQFYDRPIKLPDTPEKKSVRNYGWVNDRTALEVSSNVYMFEIGMRMAGCYYPNNCHWTRINEAYDEVRYNFSQFGLGAETGIDLPSTSTGLSGGYQAGGNLLDLMIGQFDTYTPLQLTQYISTIANDGYRMQPRLVREVREPVSDRGALGAVVQKFEPTVLSRVDMNDTYINRVQQGLRDVVAGSRGTARSFASKPYQLAAKTGTAQVRVAVGEGSGRRLVNGNNQTFVGYAPFNDPEIAIGVVVPNVKLQRNGGRQGMAQNISRGLLDAYFELKETRHGPEAVD